MGLLHHQQGDRGADHLLHRRGDLHQHPVRAQDGAGRLHRHDPRRPRGDRHLLDLQLPGHARHRGGHPDHPRLLPLRHRRGVRPRAGQHQGHREQRAVDLPAADQPVDEPDAGPVDQHVHGCHHPGAGHPPHRRWVPGCADAAVLRSGPLRRSALRGLLVDLHRLAGALHDEGARGPLGADRQPPGQAGRHQGVLLRRRRRQPEHGHQRRRLGAGAGESGSRSAQGPQQAQWADPAGFEQRGRCRWRRGRGDCGEGQAVRCGRPAVLRRSPPGGRSRRPLRHRRRPHRGLRPHRRRRPLRRVRASGAPAGAAGGGNGQAPQGPRPRKGKRKRKR